MEDVIFTLLVLAVGGGIHQVVLRLHPASFERRYFTLSFAAHAAAAFALILVYRYYYTEGGDMNGYYSFGVEIAEALRYDFGNFAPELVRLAMHSEHHFPFDVGGGGSTGTMQAVAATLLFLLGNSFYAAAVAVALASYLSKVLIYRALRGAFDREVHPAVALAVLLSPSGIVWTSALLKEPIIMVFLGPLVLAIHWLISGRRLALAFFVGAACIWPIVLIKPYVLIALILAGGVWILWSRVLKSRGSLVVKPLYFVLAFAVMLGGFALVSALVPSLSPDKLSESMAQQRHAAASIEGGSNFELGEPGAAKSTESGGVVRQLALAPLALFTALFRPLIFEARRALQFLNAIEMTWMAILFVQVVRRNSLAALLRRTTASPTLMFCLAFTLVLALGTGMSTANLGALSRYRAPMMPFFLLLLLVLRQPEKDAASTGPAAIRLTTSEA